MNNEYLKNVIERVWKYKRQTIEKILLKCRPEISYYILIKDKTSKVFSFIYKKF